MATSRVQVDSEYLDRAEDADFADKFARIEVRHRLLLPLDSAAGGSEKKSRQLISFDGPLPLHPARAPKLLVEREYRPTTLSTARSCRTGNCSKSPRLTRSATSRPSSSKVAGTVSARPRRRGTCTARGPKPSLCVVFLFSPLSLPLRLPPSEPVPFARARLGLERRSGLMRGKAADTDAPPVWFSNRRSWSAMQVTRPTNRASRRRCSKRPPSLRNSHETGQNARGVLSEDPV